MDVFQQNPVVLKHGCTEVKSFAGKLESKRKIFILGSSYGRETGPMLIENLWLKFDIVSIYKPYVVAKFVDDL